MYAQARHTLVIVLQPCVHTTHLAFLVVAMTLSIVNAKKDSGDGPDWNFAEQVRY